MPAPKKRNSSVTGTGSTAAHIILESPSTVGKLTVFQRKIQWIAHVLNKAFNEEIKDKYLSSSFRTPMKNPFYSTLFKQIFSKVVIGEMIVCAIMSYLCKRNLKSG